MPHLRTVTISQYRDLVHKGILEVPFIRPDLPMQPEYLKTVLRTLLKAVTTLLSCTFLSMAVRMFKA